MSGGGEGLGVGRWWLWWRGSGGSLGRVIGGNEEEVFVGGRGK